MAIKFVDSVELKGDMISSSSSTTEISISRQNSGTLNFQGFASQLAGAQNTKQQGITWQVNKYDGSIDYGVQAAIAVSNNGSIGTQMGFFTSNSYSGGPSERIRISAGGGVGIGTTNMYARFNVRATSHNNGISVNRAADTTAALYIGNDGGNNPILASNNSDMLFGRDVSGTFTERMRLTNSGNLGIGVLNPTRKLHISAGSGYAALFDSTNRYKIGFANGGVEEWWLASNANGSFSIHENGVGDQLTVSAGGDLTANGVITSSEGNSSQWQDAYDFSNRYLSARTIGDADEGARKGFSVDYLYNPIPHSPDSALLTMSYSSIWSWQMAGDWRTGGLKFRGKEGGAWGEWQTAATRDWVASQGYITSETDSQTLSWNGSNGQLTISNGNTVDLDGRYEDAGAADAVNTRIDEEVLPLIDTKADASHGHNIVDALPDYVWNAEQLGREFPRGIQSSFVEAGGGYPSFGSVMRINTYTGANDGGTAEMYFPYSPTYGGDTIKYRLGLYNNGGWSDWYEVASRAWTTNAFLLKTAKAADSDLLDGINSSQFVRSDQNSVTIARHLDANTAWSAAGLSLFLGWYGQKIVIGNDTNSGHDYANALGANTIAVLNRTYFYKAAKFEEDIEIDGNVNFLAGVGTWITSDVMSDSIGWNTNHGVYIGSNVGGTHYLRGNGKFTTGGSTYNLWHEGNFDPATKEAAGAADAVNLRIEEEVLPAIDTKVSKAGDQVTGALSVGGSAAYDSTNLALDVQGDVGIWGNSKIYFKITSDNYNTWSTSQYANGSQHKFNAQSFSFTNEGYSAAVFMNINSSGVGMSRNLVLGNEVYGDLNAYANWGARLFFNGSNSDAQNNYYIGTNGEDYGGNYSKLDLRWHTGIRMGAQAGYGGIRFYDNEDLNTRIMSIGETDSNIRIDNNLWIGGAGGWITDLLNAKETAGAADAVNTRIDEEVFPAIPTNNNQLTNGAGYITSSSSITGNAATATSAGYVTNQGGQLLRHDNRTISPREIGAGYLQFGFTSFQNNNTGGWADFLHLRSYTDSSGGRDNLLMFSKSDMEIRLWQQDYDSTEPYQDFRDVAFKDEIPTNNNQLTNGAGYITSFDITTQTDGKYLRSNADDSFSGNLTSAQSKWIKFYHPTQTDSNDGKIGAGVFDTGLNIVGVQTVAGTGRQVRVWGDLITSTGIKYATESYASAAAVAVETRIDEEILPLIDTKADASHTHSAADITSGTLNGARLPWASNDGFTGTYPLVWKADDRPYTASWLNIRGSDDTLFTRSISANGKLSVGNGMWVNGNNATVYNNYNENLRLPPAGNDVSVIAFRASGEGGQPSSSILGYSDRHEVRINGTWRERIYAGTTSINNTLVVFGDAIPDADRTRLLGRESNRWQIVFCEILDSAGLHEKNLQNPKGEKQVGEYETGTVLVWKGGKNIPCTEPADHMRMGIAVKDVSSPLVQGAEPVLCTGEVNEGDYLVTSSVEGHAAAISPQYMRQHGLYDCVIGKALESAEGKSHLVKTWVNI